MVALLHFAALVGAVVAQSTVETQTVPLGGGQTGTNTVTVPVSSSSAFKVETQTIPLGGGQTGTNTITVPVSSSLSGYKVETQTIPLGGGQFGTNTVTVPVSSSLSGYKVETQTIPLGGGQFGTNTVTVPLSAVMTTQVVTALTTFCPSATVLSVNNKNYTITSATTLTITDCPCTITGTMDSQATVTTSLPVAYTGAAEVVKPAVAMLALGAMALF
jgi:hypothetical protein